MPITPVCARVEQRVVIQFTNTWPTSEASWVTVPNYVPQGVSESLGNELGSASFVQYLGAVLPIGKSAYTVFLTAADAVADQAFVRVGIETSDGEIKVDPDGGPAVDALGNPIKDNYTAIHYGRVNKRAFNASDDVGLIAGITSAGLGMILDQITLASGTVIGLTPTVGTVGGEFGPFNPNGIGNRSANPPVVNPLGAVKAYVISPFSLHKWTGEDVAELLIVLLNMKQAIPFELDTQSRALLSYSDTWDFRGMNAAQILSTLANGRRGLNWKPVYIRDGTPRIRIVFDSTLSGTAPVEVPKSADDTSGESFFLKPAANQQALDLVPLTRLPQNADHRVTSCILTQDAKSAYDEIVLIAGDRTRTMSVEIKPDGTGQMVKGWATTLEPTWAAASNKELKASPRLDHVYRSFRFADGWDGKDRNGTQITNTINTAGGDVFGFNGETGEFSSSVFASNVQGRIFQPLRMTGVWQGVDFNSAIDQSTIDSLGPDQRQQSPIPPIVCLYDGTNYIPITGTDSEMSITVDPDTGCVVLGNGPTDAATIKGWLDSNYRIIITLAVRLPYPVRVSWRRNATPSRTLSMRLSASESTLAPNTIMGLNGNLVQTNTVELYLERCVSRMRSLLALAKLWYVDPEQTLTYTISGLVSPWADLAAPPPGTLITTANLPQGLFTLNQIVTRREWNFTGTPSVMITTARVLPSIDSFL